VDVPERDAAVSRDDLERLFRAHYLELVRLALYLTSDRAVAEEIVQDAFVRAWRTRRRMRASVSAHAYVRTIVVNLCRATLRRRLVELLHRPTAPGLVVEPDVAQSMDLRAALSRLPARKRACVVLRYYADMSEADTAALLGISVGTVKSQTAKALALLAPQLAVGAALRDTAGGESS
jgi:RNA polymerase sigma-70 factor (sigma-E family)